MTVLTFSPFEQNHKSTSTSQKQPCNIITRSLSFQKIADRVVGISRAGQSLGTGFMLNNTTIIVHGHGTGDPGDRLFVTRNHKNNIQVTDRVTVIDNRYPIDDIAILAMDQNQKQLSSDFEYYEGGPFGETKLLYMENGALKVKDLVIDEFGLMMNKTFKGLSGAIMISKDPFGMYKVTGLHVGEGRFVTGKLFQELSKSPTVSHQTSFDPGQLTLVGNYREEIPPEQRIAIPPPKKLNKMVKFIQEQVDTAAETVVSSVVNAMFGANIKGGGIIFDNKNKKHELCHCSVGKRGTSKTVSLFFVIYTDKSHTQFRRLVAIAKHISNTEYKVKWKHPKFNISNKIVL